MVAEMQRDLFMGELEGQIELGGILTSLFFFAFNLFLIPVLLESLNKNEQSANGQSQSRESTNPQFKKMSGDFPSANGEAGGEAPKGYTQDQVDAVKRCVHSSLWLQPAVCLSLSHDTGLVFTVL